MLARLHRDEDGFALITAVAVVAVMLILLGVVLTAGQASFEVSERNSRFTRVLGIAEAGIHDAVTMLGESRTATNPCPATDPPTGDPCTAPNGEYRLLWNIQSNGTIEVISTGYFPSEADVEVSRRVRVVLEPEPIFRYALYSTSTLDIKNGVVVEGDIFANQKVTIGAGPVTSAAVVCGSITNASGGVVTQNGAQIVKSYGTTCSGKTGSVWSGGAIDLGVTSIVQGDATASAPSSTSCPPVPNDNYYINGGSVLGTATACGYVNTSTPSAKPNTSTPAPPISGIPSFTFMPENYPNRVCYSADATCLESAPSPTAVQDFNNQVSLGGSGMRGTYVIWQQQPTSATKILLPNLSLTGDLTIITNAPVDLDNTVHVTTTVPATLAIISFYVPPTGTNCDTNGGDCSIYARNSVTFDVGDPANPEDGIAVFLYTTGKMAFKNTGGANSAGEGALYAGAMDLKNGFRVTYNGRIERMIGFGVGLEQTLWQELSD